MGNRLFKEHYQELLKEEPYDQITTCVETGTAQGISTEIMSGYFKRVITIEGSLPLYEEAKLKFSSNSNIETVFGDSSKALAEVVKGKKFPILFYLDAHYCRLPGGANALYSKFPLWEEIITIAARANYNDVIVIDDVARFGTEGGENFKEWKQVTREAIDGIVQKHRKILRRLDYRGKYIIYL
jgi:hypothetical protein